MYPQNHSTNNFFWLLMTFLVALMTSYGVKAAPLNPAVNFLTTINTTPTITGTIGGAISTPSTSSFPPYSTNQYDLTGISLFGQDSVLIKQQVVIGGGTFVSNGNIEVGASAQITADILTPQTYIFTAGNYNQNFIGKIAYGVSPDWAYAIAPNKQVLDKSRWVSRQNTSLTIPAISGTCPSITVLDDQIKDLQPGCYSDVIIRNRATVKLHGGTYVFNRFEVIQNAVAKVQFDVNASSFEGYVKNALVLDSQLSVQNTTGGAPPPNKIKWYANQVDDLIFGGHDSTLYGHLVAPNAKVIVDLRSVIGGTIKAKAMELRENATLCMPPDIETYTQTLTSGSCPDISSLKTTTPTIGATLSPLATGETFSVKVNGTTYTPTISDTTWTLAIPTPLSVKSYDVIATRSKGSSTFVDGTLNELKIVAAPTVNSATGISTTAATITGTAQSSSTITNLVVKKNNVEQTSAGKTNITVTNGAWTTTLGSVLPIGAYVVLVTDENSQTASNNLVISCPSNQTADAAGTACVTPTPPTVNDANTPDSVTVTIRGSAGTNTTISTITLTNKSTGTIQTIGTNVAVSNGNWEINSGAVTVGTYTITVTGANNLSATGTLTVTCPSPKVLNAAGACISVVIPTVDSVSVNNKTPPELKGSVGSSKSLTITIKSNPPITGSAIITGTTWSFKSTTPFTEGSYDVEAKGETGLIDDVTLPKELTVTAAVVPTVEPIKVNDRTKPTLKGNVGSSKSLTITIKSSPPITGSATITGTTWEFTSPTVFAVGNYDVEAKGETEWLIDDITTPKELTVIAAVVPTVNYPNTTTNKEAITLTGTVGTSATLKIEVKDSSGAIKDSGNATISGVTWSLTTKVLPIGIYEVVATGETGLVDSSINELNVITAVIPTVDTTSFTDKESIQLTGNAGTSKALTVQIQDSAGNVKYSAHPANINDQGVWSLTPDVLLSDGSYDVIATGNGILVDATKNELTITPTVMVPTVTKLNTDINAQVISITGTVGTKVLGSDTFTVKIHNAAHSDVKGILTVNGVNWTFKLTDKFAGIFDVDAVRNKIPDTSDKELEITDNISICDKSKTPSDQLIARDTWNGTKEGATYYLGECNSIAHSLPNKPNAFPDTPEALTPQKTVHDSPYCDDGGARSQDSATGVTIKRTTIVNATTVGGDVDLISQVTKTRYGIKESGVGNMDISQAIIDKGLARGVTLSGVTLNDVYIDTDQDYISSTGMVNSGTYITVMGGTTNKSGTGLLIPVSTITKGMITAGTTAGNPVRGSITSGRYDVDINNGSNVLTKGRRTTGKLINATIENAQTTTVNGKTVVDAGTITAGTLEGASTFGTVLNATITGANLSESNHCFSSGTVGSRGQLNWKEIVKQ